MKISKKNLIDTLLKRESDRTPREIFKDMETLWRVSSTDCLKFICYAIVKNSPEAKYQLYWLASRHKATFAENAYIILQLSSWETIIELMFIDVQLNSWQTRRLDWLFFRQLVAAGLMNETLTNKVRKALPAIKSVKDITNESSKIYSDIAKFFALGFFGKPEIEGDYSTFKKYRKLRTSNLELSYTIDNFKKSLVIVAGLDYAHKHDNVDDYLQTLQKCTDSNLRNINECIRWIENPNISPINILEVNDYWESLNVQTPSTLVVRDISSSMEGIVPAVQISSCAISKALAMLYAKCNKGYFTNKYLVFTQDGCKIHTIDDEPFFAAWQSNSEIIYSENNSLMKIAAFYKELTKVSEGELPRRIIVVSDGDFAEFEDKNYEAFREEMLKNGYSEYYLDNLQIVILDLLNTASVNETNAFITETIEESNFLYVKGYNPKLMSQLFGQDLTSRVMDSYTDVTSYTPYTKLKVVQYSKSITIAKKTSKKAKQE